MTAGQRGRDNLILIGYRGSGKTCVGRLVAAASRRPLVDTDDLVEAAAGRGISRIFETAGEAEFRRLETDAIRKAVSASRQVISIGGGAVMAERNRSLLRAAGTCIWLKASADVLMRRIEADQGSPARRPALTNAAPAEEVRQLLAAREQYYEELANQTLDTEKLDVRQAAERIIELMHWSDDRHGA